MKKIILILCFLSLIASAQKTQLEVNNYEVLTSYEHLTKFVEKIDDDSDILTVEIIGTSVQGRNLYGMYFSEGNFGSNEDKIKVLFFAQQHGNEQSGKEGALLLASELVDEENSYLYNKIDLLLIPQMNPDGSEADRRYNANNKDLNRNHLILTEPETIALHRLFNKYKFEAAMDIHEYYPYSETWAKFGYYKRADEQFGLTSNLNVSEDIRKFSRNKVLPYMREEITKRGFSFNEYLVGGPPEVERARHSTVDIDDGRQSLGIQNTLSFILEGKNGKDSSAHNIGYRAKGQKTAMLALLNFIYDNAEEIKYLVQKEREELLGSDEKVIIRMEHEPDNRRMSLPVTEISSGRDTVIELENYHPLVMAKMEKEPPYYYLVPESDTLLLDFLKKHEVKYFNSPEDEIRPVQYIITKTDTSNFEDYAKADFTIKRQEVDLQQIKYVYVPLNQLKKNTLVLAFEPESMLGLVHYPLYKHLTEFKEYPILRGEK